MSHQALDSGGRPIKFVEMTDEVCTDCNESEAGPTKFGILVEAAGQAHLECPNCGNEKHVFSGQVKRIASKRIGLDEITRREMLENHALNVAQEGQKLAKSARQKAEAAAEKVRRVIAEEKRRRG